MRVRRLDNNRLKEVSYSDLLWWRDCEGRPVRYALVRKRQLRDDVPYLRKHSESKWCVRVVEVADGEEIGDTGVPLLALAFRRALETEVAP